MASGRKRNEFEDRCYYIDGDLAKIIAAIQDTFDISTFRRASKKAADMLDNSQLGDLVELDDPDVDEHTLEPANQEEYPEPML